MPTATRGLPSRAQSGGFFNLAALENTFDNYYDDLLSPVPPGTCPTPLPAAAVADHAVHRPGRPELLDVDAIRLGALSLLDHSSGLTASQRQLSCILEYHAFFASAALEPPDCPDPCPDHPEANNGGDCEAVVMIGTDDNKNNPVPTAGLVVSVARAELGPIFGRELGGDAQGAAVLSLLLSPAGITRCAAAQDTRVIFIAFFRLLLFGLLSTDRPATPDQIARQFEVSQQSLITLSGARPASR